MLSELARDPVRARSDLAAQVSFLLQPNVANSQYGKAVAVIVDGLALQLGVSGGPIHERSALRRDRVVTVFANLTAMPATKFAGGARALWQKLYEAPLPLLSRAVQWSNRRGCVASPAVATRPRRISLVRWSWPRRRCHTARNAASSAPTAAPM